MVKLVIEALLNGVEPENINGSTVYRSVCDKCEKKFGKHTTEADALAHRLCAKCNHEYVEKTKEALKTGDYSRIIKKYEQD